MEYSKSMQIKVGVFLIIGLVMITISIFMLGADKAFLKTYTKITAEFDQVQGLAEGSVVSLSGIVVGNVDKIQFDSDRNKIIVRLKIDNQFKNLIKKDSQVDIRTQGALGDKFVFIIPGTPNSEIIAEGTQLAVVTGGDLLGVITQRGSEAGRVFDILNELYKLTKSINERDNIEKILTNVSQATANLNEASVKAKNMFSDDKLNSSMTKLDSILTKIDKGQGSLGALINDPTLHNQLKQMLGGSERKNHIKNLIRTSIEKTED